MKADGGPGRLRCAGAPALPGVLTSAEVTPAQLNLPGLTVEQIEEAERESPRLRFE